MKNASIILDKIVDENSENELTFIGFGFWDKPLKKELIENYYNEESDSFRNRTIQGFYSIKPKQKRLDSIEVL